MYPGDMKHPRGKLRLLYEGTPMAMIMKHAGGRATDGIQDILEIQPADIHEKTPLFLGSPEYMDLVDEYLETAQEPLQLAMEG